MKDPRQIVLRPIVTEKTADLKASTNTVCFQVARNANKIEVRKAVETLFGVKVVEVRVVNVRGKQRRFGRYTGQRPDWRKAYVRLAAGEKTIEFFDQV
ncbi:MAG: 50S ribosomal protein L23 [Acidobacteria bacterium 21-70-11]|jgi:large subunit ribosomal protein L23|nr:MAG: 50S ribosomal protein L23 [Acidobacteria bacterium 21-70-11]OYW06616.1 MAG: 50S ribosomal protein L23 [Acidobacteria bacterium 37-71-11]HQT93345.1 50S ribosomal protein L23 [Thermoanaerobaculaceae bacterium]